ncbi:hypothetical protein ACHAQA_001435 [Verticillium albo-atrum]
MRLTVAATLLLASQSWAQPGEYSATRHLWYDTPGQNLKSGLPIGNGRLGALVYGSASEKITINENSVWSGPFQDRTNPGSLEAFPVVRDLLTQGKYTEAGQRALRDMTANPSTNRWFSVTGDLLLDFAHTQEGWSDYERWLDTQTGIAGVTYGWDGVKYTREVVAGFDAGVIAIRLTASQEGSLSFNTSWSRDRGILSNKASADASTVSLDVGGSGADAIPFSAAVKLVTQGGSVSSNEDSVLSVKGANVVDLFVNAESSFRWGSDDKIKEELARKLDAAAQTGFEDLKSQAAQDHESLMERVQLDLGSSGSTGQQATDKRTAAYRDDAGADPEFLTLNFNFGRHLGSKYTVNINTEMNYWLAELTDLPETLPPLWDLLSRGREKGLDVAQKMYGCPGWVSHHNLDLWGDSCPHDNGTAYSIWPSSNLWLSQHLMERYRFSNDKDFLRETAWPLFVDIATFFDCYLFEFEGHWATGPSVSPENVFIIPADGDRAGAEEALDISPTSDISLLYAFFSNVIEAAEALGISLQDDEVLAKVESYRDGLRPIEIGSHGQVQEWRKDYGEAEPGHRHISHLIELFPERRMTPLINSTLADAARVSIERRLAAGRATGWAKAWIAACFARLFDGDTALEQLQGLLQLHSATNLFHEIDRGGPFQIDSNFGLVAAVAETFVQSHAGVLHVLPAASSKLAAGSVSGLVARGGFSVSVSWEAGGALKEAKVVSRNGSKLSVRVGDGLTFKIDGQEVESVETEAGKTYTITL